MSGAQVGADPSAAPRPRPLSNPEADEISAFLRQQHEAWAEEEAKREAMRSAAVRQLPSNRASGFKTTEFWVAMAGVALAFARGYGYNIPGDSFWIIVTYILGRSGMKSAAAFRSGVKQ